MTNPKQRHCNFAVILYPEDEAHQRILNFLLRFDRIHHAVGILHDSDVWQEGEELPDGVSVGNWKKLHYHVLLHYHNNRSADSVAKLLGVNYVEPISDYDSYLLYMLHASPSCVGKHEYPVSALFGNQKLISRVLTQNATFNQLREFAKKMETGLSLIDLVLECDDENKQSSFTEVYKQFAPLIIGMANQFDRRSIVRPATSKRVMYRRAEKALEDMEV